MGLVQLLLRKGITHEDLKRNNFMFDNYNGGLFYFRNDYMYLILEKKGTNYFWAGY